MTRPTFDEHRERPRLCTCGRHGVTGNGKGHALGCAWDRHEPAARYGAVVVQPDQQTGVE